MVKQFGMTLSRSKIVEKDEITLEAYRLMSYYDEPAQRFQAL